MSVGPAFDLTNLLSPIKLSNLLSTRFWLVNTLNELRDVASSVIRIRKVPSNVITSPLFIFKPTGDFGTLMVSGRWPQISHYAFDNRLIIPRGGLRPKASKKGISFVKPSGALVIRKKTHIGRRSGEIILTQGFFDAAIKVVFDIRCRKTMSRLATPLAAEIGRMLARKFAVKPGVSRIRVVVTGII